MCRNIRTLFNFEPPASEAEIRAAALQFVRKVSGTSKPSQANAAAFESAVDEIVADIGGQNGRPSLKAIGLRSRIGKGPCQGSFCSVRVTAHLYERGQLRNAEGLGQLKEFLGSRFKGQHSILWDGQLVQAELMEALHCGLFGLELDKN